MYRKRKRESVNVDAELVEIYENLANEDETKRLKAASLLLTKISPANGAEDAAREKALQRLIRGLSSGRKGARIGFSIALTEYLRTYGKAATAGETGSGFELGKAIDDLESTTHVSADAVRLEIRDHYLGKIFGAAAFIHSGVLFFPDGDTAHWERILDFVVNIAKEKSWLREESGWLMYGAVSALKAVSNGDVYIRLLVQRLEATGLLKTPEGLAIWLNIKRNFPKNKMPEGIFHRNDPLNRKEKATVALILNDSSAQESQGAEDEQDQKSSQSGGYWNPKLNFAWQVVFDELAQREQVKNSISFADMWKEAVDDGLFSMKSSHQRKYWGFHLFQHFVQNGRTENLKAVIGPNFLRCLTNQTAMDERMLNVSATQCIESMIARAKSDASSVLPMVTALLGHSLSIDRAAKTKVVEKLLAEADLDGVEKLVPELGQMLQRKLSEGGKPGQQDVLSLADYLVCLIRTHDFPKEAAELQRFRDVIDAALDFLVAGAFIANGSGQTNAAALKARIMSCLNQVITKDGEDPAHHPYHALCAIQATGFQLDAEAAVTEAVAKAHKTLDRIVSKCETADKQDILPAFKLLFTFGLLQAYYGEADAVNVIDDLQECYTTLHKKGSSGDDRDNVVALVEVIVDFISRQSALYRRLAPKILASVTDRITEKGLDVLLDVLATKEDLQGQGELFSTAGEDEMDLDGGSDDGSEPASDVEEVSDASSSASGSSSPSEQDDADAAELAAFDAKLAEALGTRRADEDMAAGDSDPDGSDMSDGAMEGLDAHLGSIFKQRAARAGGAAKDRRRARDTIINFKTKVLELLEVYVRQEHRRPAALHAVAPLLAALDATSSNLVAQKISDLVRQFSKLYKARAEGPADPQAAAAAAQLLAGACAHAGRSRSQVQAKACSSAGLLAVKAVVAHGGDAAAAVAAYDAAIAAIRTDGQFKFRRCVAEDWRNWQAQAAKAGLISK